MADKRPWFKFYPTDWRGDKALRLCGAAARGLWIEMLALMHEGKPYGHLVVNGRPVTETQLASLCGIPLDQVHTLLGELENAGVFSQAGNGVIFSRRMTRDARKAAKCAKAGKEGGGNPAFKGQGKGEGQATFAPESRVHIQDDSKKADVKHIVLESSAALKAGRTWTREQKKAAWQSKICAWAQHRLPAEDYARFLEAWANNEAWATAKAEEFNTQMRREA